MSVAGVDYSFDRPTSSTALKSAGKHFACRYLAIPPNGKILTRSEADSLAAAGVWLVANWEQTGTGSTSPETAAAQALGQAHALGIPKGRPIYASADFDVQSPDYDRAKDWITRFHKALGGEYDGRAMYGSYDLLKAGLDQGWLKWAWQTYAWSENRRDGRAQLYQHQNNVEVAGCACDLDTAYADDYGQWMPGTLPKAAEGDEMPKILYLKGSRSKPQQIDGTEEYVYFDDDGTTSVYGDPHDIIDGLLSISIDFYKKPNMDGAVQVTPVVAYVDSSGHATSTHSLGTVEIPFTTGNVAAQIPYPPIKLNQGERARFMIKTTDAAEGHITTLAFRGKYWD